MTDDRADAPKRDARRGTIPYEPGLDGLRGVAMLAMAGYHADVAWLSGSFLALDLFFVLSGYLITRLMLVEWQATGRLDLAAFWSRRARRLLPAMLFALLGIAAFSTFWAAPSELERIRGDAISTLFYVNNWWQVFHGHSYFDAYSGVSPLHPAWSLSLEEQWYLVWPLFVSFVLARSGSPRRLAWLCVGMAIASALWMFWLYVPHSDPSRVYYGTDTRAQEILLGAVLACVVHLDLLPWADRPRFWSRMGLAAFVTLVYLWTTASHAAPWVYQGGMMFVSLVTAVLIVGASQPAPNALRTIVSFKPFLWLGMISYGFYLWHLPVYLVVTRPVTGLDGYSLFVLRILVTLVVSGFSYLAIERPIRRAAMSNRAVLAFASLGTISVLLISLVATRTEPRAHELAGPLSSADFVIEGIDPRLRARDRTLQILLVGDSVAWTLGNGFIPSIEAATGIELANRAMPGCGLAHGRRREHGKITPGNTGHGCGLWPEHWGRYVDETQPDVVVVMAGGWDVFDREVDGEWLDFGSDAYDRYFHGLLEDATASLGRGGAKVVYVTSAYYDRENAASAWVPVISEDWRVDHFNTLLRQHAQKHRDKVSVVDFGEWICVDEACSAEREGWPLRTDGAHLSHWGAILGAAWLAPELHAIANPDSVEP